MFFISEALNHILERPGISVCLVDTPKAYQ